MADNYHAHTKHIDTRYHFIQQTVKDGSIILIYCPTDDMTADILTKVLPCWKVTTHALELRLCHASGGVQESGTLGEAKVEASGVGSSAGGHIACSTIVGQPVASGSATCTSAHSGARA
jgi:hypothetical protein